MNYNRGDGIAEIELGLDAIKDTIIDLKREIHYEAQKRMEAEKETEELREKIKYCPTCKALHDLKK